MKPGAHDIANMGTEQLSPTHDLAISEFGLMTENSCLDWRIEGALDVTRQLQPRDPFRTME